MDIPFTYNFYFVIMLVGELISLKSTLNFVDFEIAGTVPPAETGLPDIYNNEYIHAKITVSDKINEEERKYMGKGMISTLLPYTEQSIYDRSRNIVKLKAAVLENEYLKATFVTELGGRLWSLFDKKNNRELLYNNTCFQPCNLALRNAWFSGGVEWNVSIKGHNPLTCSPMFAESLTASDGEPVLRMYEFERKRGAVYAITARLDKDLLLINNTIENPQENDIYMYWWSNIAVPETKGTRVLAPADEVFISTYLNGNYILDTTKMPVVNGADVTYASNVQASRDFFYKIPKNNNKWIISADENGNGLLQFSTYELIGRKLFVWGQKSGGRHWNEWLSDSGVPYIEIQAGLMHTQYEHFIMPKKSTISFIEAYGAFNGNPEIVHGDYQKAVNEVDSFVKPLLTRLDKSKFDCTKNEIKYFGSGFGATEEKRLGKKISKIADFPTESATSEQAYWNALLDGKDIEEPDVLSPVLTYMEGDFWIDLIEKKQNKNWFDFYELGILYFAKGDIEGSRKNLLNSIEKNKNPWALRAMARIYLGADKDYEKALKSAYDTLNMLNDNLALCIDCADTIIKCGDYEGFANLFNSLPKSITESGRMKLFYALALAKSGKPEDARALLDDLTVYDIREGEYTLSDLWLEIHKEKLGGVIDENEILKAFPLPKHLDFRMH